MFGPNARNLLRGVQSTLQLWIQAKGTSVRSEWPVSHPDTEETRHLRPKEEKPYRDRDCGSEKESRAWCHHAWRSHPFFALGRPSLIRLLCNPCCWSWEQPYQRDREAFYICIYCMDSLPAALFNFIFKDRDLGLMEKNRNRRPAPPARGPLGTSMDAQDQPSTEMSPL